MSCMDLQLAELQSLMADLGKAGGLISPSIYDTAQVLRLYPPPEGPEPTLDWLLQQQQADGGWGDPSVSYARAGDNFSAACPSLDPTCASCYRRWDGFPARASGSVGGVAH